MCAKIGQMEKVILQKMTIEDIDEIAELDKECFAIPWSRSAFLGEMENQFASYIVAKADDKCVGYCGFWRAYDEGDITNVAVSPKFRRRGIGSRLIESIIREAREKELVFLNLEVRKSNIPAQRLYEKYGFCVVGERKEYYADTKENALIMRLSL